MHNVLQAANPQAETAVSYSYAKAVNEALRRILAEDSSSLLFGEDVGVPGGVFGVTRGLTSEFGNRVFDTPISETAMLGTALGAAMTGLRPIVEIMWIDFTLVAADQIINQIAKIRYISAGRQTAPLVIRTQQGVLPGACAQHAQNLEALYTHIPGLRVGVPTTAQDAYSMLLAAAASDDPVLVIENRGLYHGAEQPLQVGGPVEAAGGARVRRAGTDITLLTWGSMQTRVLEAAEALQQDGISAEVIDARWLNPFDWEALDASVAKTGRLMVVHEANVTGGFGAEIAANVSERHFGKLKAPVARVGLPDTSIPAAPHLQAAIYPNALAIAQRAKSLVQRS
jgi:pyruvate/2-oxoglutarate/acetoin dehydrogenase E1 component